MKFLKKLWKKMMCRTSHGNSPVKSGTNIVIPRNYTTLQATIPPQQMFPSQYVTRLLQCIDEQEYRRMVMASATPITAWGLNMRQWHDALEVDVPVLRDPQTGEYAPDAMKQLSDVLTRVLSKSLQMNFPPVMIDIEFAEDPCTNTKRTTLRIKQVFTFQQAFGFGDAKHMFEPSPDQVRRNQLRVTIEQGLPETFEEGVKKLESIVDAEDTKQE